MTSQNAVNNQTTNSNFTVNRTDSGSQAVDAVVHSQNTAGSDAKQRIVVAGTSAGDPFVEMAVGTTRSWGVGPDTSVANQPMKIVTSAAGSTTPSTGTLASSYTPFSSGAGGIAILQAAQPAVFATATVSTANVTGDGTTATVIFDSESFDVAGEYNNATGVFTAAFTGNYLFVTAVSLANLGAGHTSGAMLFLTAGANQFYFDSSNYAAVRIAAGGNYTATGTAMLTIAAGTTVAVQVQVSNSTKTVGINGVGAFVTNFMVYLLG